MLATKAPPGRRTCPLPVSGGSNQFPSRRFGSHGTQLISALIIHTNHTLGDSARDPEIAEQIRQLTSGRIGKRCGDKFVASIDLELCVAV